MVFENSKAVIDGWFRDGRIPMGSLRVMRNHELLCSYDVGFSDYGRQVPMKGDEWFILYSMTKVITSAAVLILCQDGKLSPDDRIDRYLPAMKDAFVLENGEKLPVSGKITVRDLLRMTGGCDYDMQSGEIRDLVSADPGSLTAERVSNLYAKVPLLYVPGTRWVYSKSLDVAGGVCEAITGMRLSSFVEERIFRPLGMKNASFHPSPEQWDKTCAQYFFDPEKKMVAAEKNNMFVFSDSFDSGGAGLSASIRDYSLFADCLATGGVTAEGERILSEESLAEMRKNQVPQALQSELSGIQGGGYGYGLAVRTRLKDKGRIPAGEFGWDGAAGSFVSMDPVHGISVTFGTQILNWPGAIGSHMPLLEAVYLDIFGADGEIGEKD